MTSYMDLFIANHGAPIQVGGYELYWTFWVDIAAGDSIDLSFLKSASKPIQGIALIAESCKMEIAGKSSKEFAIWTDSAPKEVKILLNTFKKNSRIGLYNIWREPRTGAALYRLHNAAMKVEQTNDASLILRCSDGVGDADFEDLVVQLTRTRANE